MEILGKGQYLELLRFNHWEYVRRRNANGVAVIIAKTKANELLLVEQFRPPVNNNVIELPAGLIGDTKGQEKESAQQAAKRELLEETGYYANNLQLVLTSPSSPGLTNELISLFLATNLEKKHDGGGDIHEKIIVHSVPLDTIQAWLQEQLHNKKIVDYKIYLVFYFLLNA